MGWKAVEWALDRGISGNTGLVLVAIASYVGDEKCTAWMKQKTIARRIDVHRSTVGRAMGRLEEEGLIRREPRYFVDPDGDRRRVADLVELVGFDPDDYAQGAHTGGAATHPREAELNEHPRRVSIPPLDRAPDPGAVTRQQNREGNHQDNHDTNHHNNHQGSRSSSRPPNEPATEDRFARLKRRVDEANRLKESQQSV